MCLRFHKAFILAPAFLFLIIFSIPFGAHALVNINTASIDELDTLPGVGATTAQYIVDGRPYASVQEISKVKGIGEPGSKTYEDIIGFITVSGASVVSSEEEVPTSLASTSGTASSTTSSAGVWYEDKKSIAVDAGKDRTVFVGADSVFEARVTGATGDLIPNARVVWSFGNGDRLEGGNVLYNFAFPGKYIVIADAANGVYSASDRVHVTAVPAQFSISEVTPEYIALRNDTTLEVDVGGWLLFSAGKQFQFPEHTILSAGQEVFISNKRTGLSGNDPGAVALQYPNGLVATAYEYPLFLAGQGRMTPTASSRSTQGTQSAAAASGEVKDEVPFADQGNLITSPIAATNGDFGLWLWLLAVGTIAGLGSAAVVYARRRKVEYAIEEIS